MASLQNQMEGVQLQDKLGKQNFHEDTIRIFEPKTDTIENNSRSKKTMTLASKEKN